MAFRDGIDAPEPTHRLVVRNLSGVKDWDDNGSVTVENRIVDVCMDYGTDVHLRVDPDHNQFDTVARELRRVPTTDRLFQGSEHEYRASLPDDQGLVQSVLDIPVDDTDAWVDRLFALDEFGVLVDDSWLYHSVPHHSHIREINAAPVDGLLAALAEVLESVDGAAVVPFGPLAAWTTEGTEYELTWNVLRRRADSDRFVVFSLSRLERVSLDRSGDRLRLDWRPASEESVLRRAIWWLFDSPAASPPTRIEVHDDGEAVLDAFRELREELGYVYVIEESER